MVVSVKKYKLVLFLIVIVGPLLDLMTGYVQLVLGISTLITPGVVYRGFILVVFFFTIIHIVKANQFRIFTDYFIIVFALGVFIQSLIGHDIDIISGLQRLFKIMFPILGFGALVYISNKYSELNTDGFLWWVAGVYGLIVSASIVVFFLTGTGLSTYRYGFSSAALFGSQNATSIILAVSLPILLYYLYKYKTSFIILLLVEALFIMSAFLLGTRAAIIGVPSMIVLFHAFTFVLEGRRFRLKKIYVSLAILVGILLIGFLVYRYWSQQDISYMIRKFEQLAEGDFRRRTPAGIATISNFNLWEHLFGIGDEEFELTENDIVDIYGKFGLFTLIPLLAFFFRYYLGLLFVAVRRIQLSTFVLIISFTFYFLHGALAGHAFTQAQSNNLFMVLYFLAYDEIKSKTATSVAPEPKLNSDKSAQAKLLPS